MADNDQSIYTLRYNQLANELEGFGGGSPAWSPLIMANAGGITQLTGDVTAGPGSGSKVATLATVNASVGSFTYTNITVNAKGLITAASSGTAPVTSVSGTASDISSTGGITPVLDLVNTAVTPGAYTSANITIDAKGRITTAANGPSVSAVGPEGAVQFNTGGAFDGSANLLFAATPITRLDITGTGASEVVVTLNHDNQKNIYFNSEDQSTNNGKIGHSGTVMTILSNTGDLNIESTGGTVAVTPSLNVIGPAAFLRSTVVRETSGAGNNAEVRLEANAPDNMILNFANLGNSSQYAYLSVIPSSSDMNLVVFGVINLFAGNVSAMQLDNSGTATETRMLVWDVDSGALQRVTVGAADSGGVGFKVLRIPN
jgi:hypothetical protein